MKTQRQTRSDHRCRKRNWKIHCSGFRNAGIERAAREFGALDVLVSNAGIQIIHPIVDFPFSDWRKVIAIHLDGAFLTTRAAMRLMIQRG